MDYKVVIYVNDSDATHTDAVRKELWSALATTDLDFSIASVAPIETATGADGKRVR
jgi:hypothetical protein